MLIICSEEEKAKKDPKYYLNRANKDTLGILSELERTYKEPVSELNFIHDALCWFCNSGFNFPLPMINKVTLSQNITEVSFLTEHRFINFTFQEKKSIEKTESLTERNAVGFL